VSKTWRAISEKILYSENIFWLFTSATRNPFFSQCLRCRIFSLVRHLGIEFAYFNYPWNLKLEHCKSLETLQVFHVRRSWRHPKISFWPARATEAALAAHIQRGEIELRLILDSETVECRHMISGLPRNIVVRVAMDYFMYSAMLEQDWDVCAHHFPSIRCKLTDTEVVPEPSGVLHDSSCGCGA
jgi:hypothetical protein